MDLHPNTCISGPAVLKLGPVFHDAMERPGKKGLHPLIQKHFKYACAGCWATKTDLARSLPWRNFTA